MSYFEAQDPRCETKDCPNDVETIIVPRSVDLGGFDVSRVLPSAERRMVGPFVFWDQFGRSEFLTGQGVDVRPHPHIGLATLTYLFEGSIEHRDNLGSHQVITPGDVNLMVAGKGIVHSERTGAKVRTQPHSLFGLQIWLALPRVREEMAPSFHHHKCKDLIFEQADGVTLRLVAGELSGLRSHVDTYAGALLADVKMSAGSSYSFPGDTEERAVHVVSGNVRIGQLSFGPAQMLVLKPGHDISITADVDSRVVFLGGDALDGPRHLWWNFVSSSKERIEQAKQDWGSGRFAKVPGDEKEFIPLPNG